jgi:hypothetical protein
MAVREAGHAVSVGTADKTGNRSQFLPGVKTARQKVTREVNN